MDLTNLIQGAISPQLIEQLAGQIGGADRQQTAAATEGIVDILMGAMARNASTPQGASALDNALQRDHDGSILGDLMSAMAGGATNRASGQISGPLNERTMNGSGILEHILGNRKSGAADVISKMSGLDSNKTGNLMAMLAPVIMGMLGKAKRENNLDAGGVSDLLGGYAKQQQQQNPAMSILTGFLDADGDGSIIDDVAGMLGKGLLGGLFGRK
ncbi:MAG: DUF937 domain-containing protein [Bacteroidota bacterium]